jgi:hypothetical protein
MTLGVAETPSLAGDLIFANDFETGDLSLWSSAVTGLPPDPTMIAPPLDPTVATDIADSIKFLYEGNDPIQSGVEEGAVDSMRAAVLKGRVLQAGGSPLAGVRVSSVGQPELGQTLTRSDGMFDLVVNGGEEVTLRFERAGYLPADRTIETPWRDYRWIDDLMLIRLDDQVTQVTMGNMEMQVARGTEVTDEDGARQTTLMFPEGNTAEMVLVDGTRVPLATLAVRATEYTVGSDGPKRMPAALPSNTGYTYAVELSVDAALEAGAVSVEFDQPVIHYVENFVGFPVASESRWAPTIGPVRFGCPRRTVE